jgi:Tudor domain
VKTNLSNDCHDRSHETLALYCADPLLTGRKVAPKPSCSIRKYSAGEIFEVDTLECVEFKEIIANSNILGDLPPDGSYIVAVQFLACLSPDAIFFRPLQYEAKYHEMMSDMQRSYRSSRIDPISTFDVDSHCAAFICGQWIRIIIKRLDPNLHCLAIDMDNGQPYELSASKIYPLVSPFDTVPKMALKCSMFGLGNKIKFDMLLKITSDLLQAEEIYLSCPQRPKAIPPIFAATIHYAQSDDKGKTLINMNSQLSV